ncbi:MAG: DUF389 domain-containing protein, partial [Hymenobacteraceae bacterium]|nr:DUF389 domain-containing protein [Hymenobacteraceae bacterium]MDX5394652.1 DUF389 domain-containing protein [Hymenobacteraceae bacterium]MDX5510683.1 DUF389 domain-containing protein [Hymenobacteraceae bacterium]
MNLAIATTAGEKALFRKSLTRYFVSINIGAAVAALLSWLIGQQTATSLMIDVGQVSEVSLLLPLISGFAGALSMVQDERDSLVSGAAIGILVSASLAPPVGLVGMGAVCGEWALVRNGAFLILLQLAGINLSAALVFRFYGKITTKRIRFNNGSKALAFSVGLGSLAVIALLLWFQFSKTPRLQKGSINMKIAETIKNNFKTIPEANLIETTVSFTRADSKGTERLLCEVLVTPKPAGEKLTDAELKELLFKKLDQEVKHRKYNIKPVFNITVLREGTAP